MDPRRKAAIDAKRKALLEEEAHYRRVAAVFGSDDGKLVLGWVLDLCGYWSECVADERALGRFELGRTIFNHICLADIDIANHILRGRRELALEVRRNEQRRLAEQEKENI